MIKKLFVAGAMSLLLPILAWAITPDVQPIDVWERVEQGVPIIDVRTPREFSQGHVPGSVNIPYDEIGDRASELPAVKDKPVIVYCASGNRSSKAKAALISLGYTNVLNAGGYDEIFAAKPKASAH